MKREIKRIVGECLLLMLLASCSQSDKEEGGSAGRGVHFTGQVSPHTRATDSGFEDEDDISVFAFAQDAGFTSTSYAENVRHVYLDGQFNPDQEGITYPEDGSGLSFWAIHPYCKEASSVFTFHVQEDQRRALNYTHSDLMTASVGKTTNLTPNLTFTHRLSCVTVRLTFEDPVAKAERLDFCQVTKSALVDMASTTFVGTGDPAFTIRATPEGEGRYKVILPPQKVRAETGFVTITTVEGKVHTWRIPKDLVFESGCRYTYNLKISVMGTITFTADIDPWGEPEDIEAIIPPVLLDSIDNYIPIHRGSTPPNVEGVYLMRPMTTVYCQDNGYEPGSIINSEIVKFANQDNQTRTLEYSTRNLYNTSTSQSYTSYISGSGNNFTIFLESKGETNGIFTRTANICSGSISDKGIVDLQYAFVMLEKGEDLHGELMNVGVFRIFHDGDGMSMKTTWDYDPENIGNNHVDITKNALIGTWEAVWHVGSNTYSAHPEQDYSWNSERTDSSLMLFRMDDTGSGFFSTTPFTWSLKGDSLGLRHDDDQYIYNLVIKKFTSIGMVVDVYWVYSDTEYGFCEHTDVITYRKVNNSVATIRSLISGNKSMDGYRSVNSRGILSDWGMLDSKSAPKKISARKGNKQ